MPPITICLYHIVTLFYGHRFYSNISEPNKIYECPWTWCFRCRTGKIYAHGSAEKPDHR